MNKNVLAIDAGNTRIKWGAHDGTHWLRQAWLDTSRAAELGPVLAGLATSLDMAAEAGMPAVEARCMALADRFVGMYVNHWTLDYGEKGKVAIRTLLRKGY